MKATGNKWPETQYSLLEGAPHGTTTKTVGTVPVSKSLVWCGLVVKGMEGGSLSMQQTNKESHPVCPAVARDTC